MATERQYRERAKEARKTAEAAANEATRLTSPEVAKGFERLADQPGKQPWHVERVERKK
jgi:hypothetical protein